MTTADSNRKKGIRALIFMQMFSTLGFSILYSSLVLYATEGLKLNDQFATALTGSFIAFNYTLHVLGGYIGGRLMSYRSLFTIGMLLQAVGSGIIALGSLNFLIWGTACFLAGCGLNVICINCMLTQLFDPNDKKRETVFLWNYSAMNVGFFIGFTLSGIAQSYQYYFPLLIFAAVGSLISFFIALANWSLLQDINTHFSELDSAKKKTRTIYALILITLLILGLSWLLIHAQFSTYLILSVGVFIACLIAYLAYSQPDRQASNKMWAFLFLTFGSLVFWSLYQMAPMGLTLFFNRNVDRNILGFTIQPQWMQNINTLLIVTGGPLIAYFNQHFRNNGVKITIPRQFTVAILLIALGFLLLPAGIHFADANGFSNIGWIIGCYFLQSIGELFISPIGFAMIGQLIPAKLQALVMGAWLMVTGIAAVISNFFSQMALGTTSSQNPMITNSSYSHVFMTLGCGALLCSLILFLSIRFLEHLIQEPHTLKSIEPAPYNAPQD